MREVRTEFTELQENRGEDLNLKEDKKKLKQINGSMTKSDGATTVS